MKMQNEDDDTGYYLSPERFVEKVEKDIVSLTQIILGGLNRDDYQYTRGKIIEAKRLLEMFKNNKK